MGRAAPLEASAPSIRPARVEDAPGLSELLGVLGYPCPREEAAARVLTVREDPNQTLLVAEDAGVVVGLMCCDVSFYLPLGERTCRITALAVRDGAQRNGVGRLLLREAETLARSAAAVRIELTSAQSREQAHAFYRACGYSDGALRFVKRLGEA